MQSKRTIRLCETCGKPFNFWPWMETKGGGRFCRRRCYWDSISLRTIPLTDRFWAKVNKNGPILRTDLGPCWVWTGTCDNKGYGRLMTPCEDGKRGHKPRLAHRISWEMHFGTLPSRIGVLHRCDNPPCVRPDHLFSGSQADNMADCAQKGRTTLGERGSGAKLTNEQVREIRRRYADGDVTMTALGHIYGVRPTAIRQIVNGVTWRHLLT